MLVEQRNQIKSLPGESPHDAANRIWERLTLERRELRGQPMNRPEPDRELVGKLVAVLLHPDCQELLVQAVKLAFGDRIPSTLESAILGREGGE